MPARNSPADQAALAWLAKRHSGHWTAADEQAHAAWLAASPDHPAAWQRAQALWLELADLRPLAAAGLLTARQRAAPVPPPPRRGWQNGLALAGIGALAFGLLVFWLPGSLDTVQTRQTARGEQRTLTLADGSSIELNTATQVQIDYSLTCRCVRLTGGEAVFRVAHRDPRRFEVSVDNNRIRDIGTEFWLRGEPARTAVAVLDGEIEVTPKTGGAPTRLHAGEQLALGRDGQLLTGPAPPLADLLAWRDGALVFRDSPLTEVLREFSRYHNVNIEMDTRLRDYRLSGRLKSADLDGLLALIRSAYPVAVHRPTPDRLRIQVSGSRG